MAAFSSFQHHHQPFPLETSSLVQFSSINTNLDQPNMPLSPIPQFYQTQEIDHSSIKIFSSGPSPSPSPCTTNKSSSTTMDSSSIVTHNVNIYGCDQKVFAQKVKNLSMEDKNKHKRKSREGPSANSAQSKVKREMKGKKQKKTESDNEVKKKKIEKKNTAEKEGPTGYIHVRARRGQATDSHSLAERVRREKISERMKQLQAIVPGCDKVTGKALMLDEIINYVQSLQNQVEFLSMKLASVNPMCYDFGMDLYSFMVRPDQVNSPIIAHNYPLLDNSANSFLFQPPQIPYSLHQGSRQALWEVDKFGQKHINQSGIESDIRFSSH